MFNRRKAVVGYATYEIARRIARRQIRRRLADLRPGRPKDLQGGLMLKRTKGAGAAATDRATALVDTVRPIVQRAISDPELHEALRQAFNTGREVTGEISGTKPSKAAKKLAHDRKLQQRVESSAHELQRAVSGVVEGKPRRGKVRRALGTIAIVGGIGGAVLIVMRKLRGEQDHTGV